MKGAIGLGLIIGIIGAMFLPYVFALINDTHAFDDFTAIITGLNANLLAALITPAIAGIPTSYDPNIIAGFTGNFMLFLPAMLTWIVCGLLAALFTQSAKKGIISAAVFIAVEILVYLLMRVLGGDDLITEVIAPGNDPIPFIGGAVITPVLFGIVGGLIGGFISRFAFGPEEI
nr:hypothetical protein [Candidatus Sigynarchaeota archaeon]